MFIITLSNVINFYFPDFLSPTDLKITQTTHNSVTLAWEKPNGDMPVTGYLFETVINPHSHDKCVIKEHNIKHNVLTHTVDGLDHRDQLYDFRVAAKYKSGNSQFAMSQLLCL